MHKKFLIIAPLAALFLTGCTLLGEVESVGCGFLEGKTQDHCYKDAALRSNDPAKCEEIQGAGFQFGNPAKARCYQELALETSDASLCAKISGGGSTGTTKEECYQKLAIQTGDVSLCENITTTVSRGGGWMVTSRDACIEKTQEILAQAEEVETEEGECRFDSDCDAICEDNIFWKMGCNARTNVCEKTFDTNCVQEKTILCEFQFSKFCQSDGCADDENAIRATKNELVALGNQYSSLMEETTKVRRIVAENCISVLEDVTNKLIIDTALQFGSLSSFGIRSSPLTASPTKDALRGRSLSTLESQSLLEKNLITDPAKQLIDTLAGKVIDTETNKPAMPIEEYIALNCKAIETLDTEFKLLDKKRGIVIEKLRCFEGY